VAIETTAAIDLTDFLNPRDRDYCIGMHGWRDRTVAGLGNGRIAPRCGRILLDRAERVPPRRVSAAELVVQAQTNDVLVEFGGVGSKSGDRHRRSSHPLSKSGQIWILTRDGLSADTVL